MERTPEDQHILNLVVPVVKKIIQDALEPVQKEIEILKGYNFDILTKRVEDLEEGFEKLKKVLKGLNEEVGRLSDNTLDEGEIEDAIGAFLHNKVTISSDVYLEI